MKLIIATLALLLSFTASTPALARTSVPIENLPNNPAVASSGKILSIDDVKRVIQAAALYRNWSLTEKSPGTFLATLNVRGKHTIMVDITYTETTYSISYSNSSNMNYTSDGGQGLIHPNYNKWVQDFRRAIQAELLKL